MVAKDKRSNNPGAKPKGEKKKIPITIYRPADQVEKSGGIAMVRNRLSNYFDDDYIDEFSKK